MFLSEAQHAAKEDIHSEREFFDKYYRESREHPPDPDMSVWVEKATHPSSRPLDYFEYAFYLMGDLRGRQVLDLACGGGWISRLLALKGAQVAAFDVSIEGCSSTRHKLNEIGARCDRIAVMDAHAIAFKNSSFDAVVINGALHHLNIAKVALEIHRILKPGGKVVYCEPLRYGPVMRALKRMWLRINGMSDREETEHEEGLKVSDFAPFAEVFQTGSVRGFNFVAKTARLRRRFGRLANSLRWIDYIVLSFVPFFHRYCTCTVGCFLK